MKIKPFNILLTLFVILMFQRCGSTDDIPGTEGNGSGPGTEVPGTEEPGPEEPGTEGPFAITLGGKGLETLLRTRAGTDFPNNEMIAVTAAAYNNGGPVNWTTYTDIQNAPAEAFSKIDSVYYFNWATQKYWPFDGSRLVFLAYSPVSNGQSVTVDASNTGLDLVLQPGMQDVLYASNNVTAEANGYNKSDSIVDLGEFRHALSKITVQIRPGEDMNPNVSLDTFLVETPYRTAHLDLLAGDAGLTLGADSTYTYELTTTSTDFLNTFTREILVYPGTAATTRLYVSLSDGTFRVNKWYLLSDFENKTRPNQAIEFNRGYNTILRFTVVGMTIEMPNDQIVLEGLLTDWNNAGDYNITIE